MQRSSPASAFLTWDMDATRKPFLSYCEPLATSLKNHLRIQELSATMKLSDKKKKMHEQREVGKNLNFVKERAIRVFISSTFKDMKAERNELILHTFPRLRKLCETRGVLFTEIDLRWGITDEKVAEGKVLPICLEEINKCRPFFIGILGERYGWINSDFPYELIKREAWLKEHITQKKSITELEILHGVLNNPKMKGLAYFYFRNANYHKNLNDLESTEFSERKKINDLKEKISSAAKANYCNLRPKEFIDAEQLGEWVYEDFEKIINKYFPANEETDELAKIRNEQELILKRKTNLYIRQENQLKLLDSYVENKEKVKYPFIVLGKAGEGKSTLLATWAIQFRKRSPDVLLILHFLGKTDDSTRHYKIIRRILLEIKSYFNVTEEIQSDSEKATEQLSDWLNFYGNTKRIIIILDRLHLINNAKNAINLNWLPLSIPKEVYLIISIIPGEFQEVLKNRNWYRTTYLLEVQPFSRKQKENFIQEYLRKSSRELGINRINRIVSAKHTSTPIYIKALLEELCYIGEHERLDEQIDDYLSAVDVTSLYKKIIKRWEAEYSLEQDLVSRFLQYIWVSRNGLSENEILSLLGDGVNPLPRAYLSSFFAISESITIINKGFLDFENEYIRDAVFELYCEDPVVIRQVRFKIAQFFTEGKFLPERILTERPWQLRKANFKEELKQFLLSPLMLRMMRDQQTLTEALQNWLSLEDEKKIGKEVIRAFEEMINIRPEPFSEGHIANSLEILVSELGYQDEALWFNDKAKEYFSRNSEKTREYEILIQNNKATALIHQGRLEEAKSILEKILKESDIYGTQDQDDVLTAASNYAHIFHLQNEISHSYEIYKETAERTINKYGKRHPGSIKRYADVICLDLETDHPKTQEHEILEMIKLASSVIGATDKTTMVLKHCLGGFYEKSDSFQKALKIYSEGYKFATRNFGKDALQTLNWLQSYSRIHMKLENYHISDDLYANYFELANNRYGGLHFLTLNCFMLWVYSILIRKNTINIDEQVGIIMNALVKHLAQFGTEHSKHSEILGLCYQYTIKKGGTENDFLKQYTDLVNNIKQTYYGKKS